MDGVVVIDKPKDLTSRDVVNIASKKLKTKKIGHTGTLDPLATGVLVLCVGKATKLVELLTAHDKEYIAEVILGIKTDTLDITGTILEEENIYITKEKIEKALQDMTGTYNQEVPIYSAVKINGKKLYEYARNNESVTLPKRMVNIKEIKLIGIKYENNKTIFKIKCHVSKGTYIRSLIRDIALKLGTIGVMANLRRVSQGDFALSEANNLNDETFKLIPIKDVLKRYKQVVVDNLLEFKIKNGQVLDNIYNSEIVVFLNKNEEVLAVYKKDNQNKLRVYKMF